MQSIKIAAVQMLSSLGDTADNCEHMAHWIAQASDAGADLVFFPECCLTGYSVDCASSIAIDGQDNAIVEVEEIARRCGVALGYGFIERGDGANATNAPFVTYKIVDAPHAEEPETAEPAEELVYRKTHLGSRERNAFQAGSVLCTVNVHGICMGVELCWESHIPDISTTLRSRGAQLVLMPHASGPGGAHRLDLWNRYLPARALDNGMFVIATNALRKGVDDIVCGGGIGAWAPDGMLLGSYAGTDEKLVLFEVGGALPREDPTERMLQPSYFDRRRPELYRLHSS